MTLGCFVTNQILFESNVNVVIAYLNVAWILERDIITYNEIPQFFSKSCYFQVFSGISVFRVTQKAQHAAGYHTPKTISKAARSNPEELPWTPLQTTSVLCNTKENTAPFLPLKNTATTECYDPFTRMHGKVSVSRPLTKYICTIILKDSLMLCYIPIVSNISYQIMIPSLGQNDPTTETHTGPTMSHNILGEEVLIQSRTDTHN